MIANKQIGSTPRSICREECYREHRAVLQAERETQSNNRNQQFKFFFADRGAERTTVMREPSSVNGLVKR